VVEHRQVVNYIDGVVERAEFPLSASFASYAASGLDFSVTVLYPALSRGGCLHLISEELATDPVKLGAYFEEKRVDCLKIYAIPLSSAAN